MNTLDKVYNLTVDIKNIDTKYNSYAKFFDDDRETSVIKVKILNNNSPIDLENCSVEAYFVLANNTYHNETCKIINSSEGIVELQLCQKCLVKGKNIVRLSILKDNEIANTPIITYEVRKGLYSDNPNFNDDPLTPILSQMLLDIKVTKVNQIELQERYEKTLPKIEGKIEEVDNAIDRVNNAIASGTQDLEVKEARVDKNGKSYSKLGDRLDSVDSQLAHIAINVVNFGAKGDGLADDTEAFINALNYAKGKGRVIIPPGTYRISRTLPFYSNMIIEGNITSSHISSKDYPMIIFEGENYLFDSIGVLDEVVSDYSYIKLGNLRIKSVKDAGGFLAFNRDREFENAPDKPISQGHLLRFIAENLIIEKEVDASGIASKNTNSIAINVVGLMNSTIKNCEFRGWNLALRLYQSDINTFDHCWFVSNLKVLESNHLNTYGSQNVFRDCDFEVRRNNTENNWMFEDTSYFLKFDNCYFEIGSSAFTPTSKPSSHATYNRIKGWFNFSSGKDCTFSNCRWDWIDDFASDCFMNIENKRSLVNFVSCSNVAGFNNDFSKKVRVNHMPKMATDYDNLSDYGRVNLISCSKYFITFFDLEHPNVFISNKNVELDEVKYNNIVYGEKGFIYDYRTKAPSKSGTYDMYYDEKSKKPYVFKLNKLNKKQDQLRFKTILGKNSMFELHKTHNIRIRARSLSDSQNSKIAIRLYHYRGESLIKAPINYNSTINNINYKDFEFKITIDTSYNLNDYIILDILNLDTTNSSTDEFILVEEIQVTDIQNQLYLPTVAQTDIVELKNGSVFFDGNLRTKIDNKIKTNLLVSNYIDYNRSPYSSIVNVDYDTFNSDFINGRLSIKADGANQYPSFVEYNFLYLANANGAGQNTVILSEINSFHRNRETIEAIAYIENNTELKIKVQGTGGSKHLSYRFITF